MTDPRSLVRRMPGRVVVRARWLAVIGLLGCELKPASFFAPSDNPNPLLDLDAPLYENRLPASSLGGPFRINVVRYDIFDRVGSNGAVPSGVDWSSLRVLRGMQPLTTTRDGNSASASLSGIADGPLSLQWSVKDLRGNERTDGFSIDLKNSGPTINFTLTPPVTWTSNALSERLQLQGAFSDPYFHSATGNITRPGNDNSCGTADDVAIPQGTGPGQISANSFLFSTGGAFGIDVLTFNGVPSGGTPVTARYCLVMRAQDRATDALGVSSPNITTRTFESALTWQPPSGSVAGIVTVNNTPTAGLAVSAGGQTTTTGADGGYRIDGLALGQVNVALAALPPELTCSPASATVTITSNVVATANFACTRPTTGSIAGVVTVNGTPRSGIGVSADGRTAFTGADGTYRFDNVMPGQVTVTLTSLPIGVTCSPSTANVAVVAGQVTMANFPCSQVTTGSIAGVLTVNGLVQGGVGISAGGMNTMTAIDGTYRIDGLVAGTVFASLGAQPQTTTCSQGSRTVQVTAGLTTTVNFTCTRTFATTLSLSYRHLGSTSEVCVAVSTAPLQPNTAYSLQLTGPGVIGSTSMSGTLNSSGTAFVRYPIGLFGTYTAQSNILTLTASNSLAVTAPSGNCPPPP